MKLYSKILGILSALTILSLLGFIVYLLLFEYHNSTDTVIALSLLIPVYVILHFLIIHRFGFSLNTDYSQTQKNVILVLAIISFGFLFTIPLKGYLRANRILSQEQALEEMRDWGTDTTAFNYYGNLKTKYVDRKIFYQLTVTSKDPFRPSLTGFTIHLLDGDGFLIEKISITEYSTLVDEEKTFGVQSNSNNYMDMQDYSRVGKWDLLVTTRN